MLKNRDEAFELLRALGASDRLLLHAEIVSEVAVLLAQLCKNADASIDPALVEIGAIIHDSGKIIHVNELSEPGNKHEAAGNKLMLENGASREQARFCLSHAQFNQMSVSLEELTVALADKIWKGKRVVDLELKFLQQIALSSGKDQWVIYSDIDDSLESIASEGDIRLERSKKA